MNVTAIVLAAGSSSRMGRPKQLLPFEGKSLVRRAAEAAVASNASHTIVVTGANRQEVEAELTGLAVRIVHNPAHAEGMSTSLKAGLRAVRPEVDAVVVTLADQPFVDAAIVDTLIALYERTHAKIVRPRYGGQAGNPVLWDRAFFDALLQQEGDQGGRALLQQHASEIVWLELPDSMVQTDVDTPEAYAALTAESALSPQPPFPGVGDETPLTPQPPLPHAGEGEPVRPISPLPRTGRGAGGEGTLPRTAQGPEAGESLTSAEGYAEGHPHIGGNRFCTRCATPLVVKAIAYDGGREHQTCPACNFVVWADPKVAVLTVIPWEGGILLGKRTQNPGKGRWSFPSGFVDRGEAVEDAARRETLEETGLEVELTGLVGVYSEAGNPVIVIAYGAEPGGGTLRADDDLAELQAYDPDALPEMAFPHDIRIVRDWQALRSRMKAER